MSDAGVGWVAAIIIGAIAGWLAEQFMKSNMGLLMNIVLGIVGAAVASAILSVVRDPSRRLDWLSDRGLHRRLHPDRSRPARATRVVIGMGAKNLR